MSLQLSKIEGCSVKTHCYLFLVQTCHGLSADSLESWCQLFQTLHKKEIFGVSQDFPQEIVKDPSTHGISDTSPVCFELYQEHGFKDIFLQNVHISTAPPEAVGESWKSRHTATGNFSSACLPSL